MMGSLWQRVAMHEMVFFLLVVFAKCVHELFGVCVWMSSHMSVYRLYAKKNAWKIEEPQQQQQQL